jgi:cob(I)alamin adenosyltransferase
MIYVLTGNGKGKTTSAIGMAIRAVGAGQKVLMIQFLKDEKSSEVKVIKRIKSFDIRSFGRLGFRPFSKKDKVLARKGLNFFKKEVKKGKHNLIILDEINLTLFFNLIPVKKFLVAIKDIPEGLDLVFTGRKAPKEIIKVADLVTEFKEIKHYYKRGVKAKKGREY